MPGGGGPSVVLIVVVSIAGLLLCIVLGVMAFCLLWCCVKMKSRKRKGKWWHITYGHAAYATSVHFPVHHSSLCNSVRLLLC